MSEPKSITMDNVLDLLEASINNHGGKEVLYKDRLIDQLVEAGVSRDNAVELGGLNCYYVTPEIPEDGDPNGEDRWVRPKELKPSCLIGCLMIDLGVPATMFYDEGINDSGVLSLTESPAIRNLVTIDPDAAIVLTKAQEKQDHGCDWGCALDEAKALHAEITKGRAEEASDATV